MMSNQRLSSPRMEVGLGAVGGSATGMESGQGIQQTRGLVQETAAAPGMARQRSDIVCREWKGQGCFRGASCQFAHPVGRGRALPANKDCYYWLSGFCRYSPTTCSKGQHVPHKLGSRPRRTRTGQENSMTEVQGTGGVQQSQDFLQSLAAAVSQAVAGAPGSLQTLLQQGQQGLQGGLASQ